MIERLRKLAKSGVSDAPRPMTYAEQVSDLIYSGKTLEEIAGYTPTLRAHVLYLPRDHQGRLKRIDPDLPPWLKVDDDGMRIPSGKRMSFKEMFFKRCRKQGKTKAEAEVAWKQYQDDNPKMGRGGPLDKDKRSSNRKSGRGG